ncbi:MAG: type III pantothenate kinase [Parahaliea sp.]
MSPPRRCLQLDVGNSSAKWRLVVNGEISARGRYRREDEDSRQTLLACAPALDAIWISSVAREAVEGSIAAELRRRWNVQPWVARSEAESLGLRNSYAEPVRMGVDRWLAMLAARARHRGRLCVIDAGSALTVDLVADDGAHEGGYIIPGLELMERALLLDTDRVRFADDARYQLRPGRSTAEAVRHGIALAQAGAVAQVLRSESAELAVLFTGGDGQWLQEQLEGRGEYVPELVLDGLQRMGEVRAC